MSIYGQSIWRVSFISFIDEEFPNKSHPVTSQYYGSITENAKNEKTTYEPSMTKRGKKLTGVN